MSFASAFFHFVGPQLTASSPRLVDWLASISMQQLLALRDTIIVCREGEGQTEQEDDLLRLTRLHHIRENNTELEDQDNEGWIAAFDDFHRLVRYEHYRREGVNADLMEALFEV